MTIQVPVRLTEEDVSRLDAAVASGRWRQGPTPGVTRHALQAFYAGGALYTVGGCTTALRDSQVVERLALRS